MTLRSANVDDIAMSTVCIYQTTQLLSSNWAIIPYFSISLSLNVLLTLMIVVRLVLHTRNIRTNTGVAGIGELCKTIVTILIESCALYTVSSLLIIGPWAARGYVVEAFFSIIAETQVRAFPCPRSSGSLYNVTADWIGHRTTARCSTNRQQKRVDEYFCHLRTYQ